MTVSDVKNAIIGYGFATDLDDNDALFYTALNLALREVNAVRPLVTAATLLHLPYAPVAQYDRVQEYTPASALSFTAVARSSVFEVSGAGQVRVTCDGATIKQESWSGISGWKRVAVSSEIAGEMTVEFHGDSPYYIRAIAFYSQYTPPSAFTKNGDVEYDLKAVFKDYSALSEIMLSGMPTHDFALIDGHLLRLPADKTGTYDIVYEVVMPRYTADNDSDTVPLDDDVIDLLPLRVAAYVWISDADGLGKTYLALYREAANNIKPKKKSVRYLDTRGWT